MQLTGIIFMNLNDSRNIRFAHFKHLFFRKQCDFDQLLSSKISYHTQMGLEI